MWFARFAWFAWFANKTDPKFLAVYSANKLQFLHILEYCGMQGKYENRVKNDNNFFLKFLVFYLAKQSRKNQNNLLHFYVVLYPTLILYISWWWIYT